MTAAGMAPLDPELTDFIGGPVSISIGSRDAAMLANLTRGFGCRVSADRQRIRLFVSRVQSRAVLADLAANGHIAAVFTLPASHRTVQLKGRDAQAAALAEGDAGYVACYRAGFVAHLAEMGYPAETIAQMVDCPAEELVAIDFTPSAAFTQTPGPRAGQPLERP